jgi:hypothetical protein
MHNQLLTLAFSLLFWLAPTAITAQTLELQAVEDFINLDSGEVPYYLDLAGTRNALAINAAKEEYREKFARAEYEFLGSDGLYDLTIHALGEIDGDCEYRLLVNGIEIGAAINPPVDEDYKVIEHTFKGVALNFASIIAVESNAVSNGIIPEGDGYAFARGRWRSLFITPSSDDSVSQDFNVDLGLTLDVIGSELTQNQSTTFFISTINLSSESAATNAVVDIELPASVEFEASAECTASATGARCFLPELPASESLSLSFVGRLIDSGDVAITASVMADQTDPDNNNNSPSIAITVAEAVATDPDDSVTDQTDNSGDGMDSSTTEDTTTEDTSAESDTAAGATWVLLLILMICRCRRYGAK